MKGSVKKRGAKWYCYYYSHKDANGKWVKKWRVGGDTEREAEAELRRILRELDTGGYVEPAKETVGQFLERWLNDYAKPNVAAKTLEGYENIARLHLAPALGHHQLARLSPVHIQAYYSQALVSGRRHGEGGLSARTVLHHHRVLRE